METQIRKYWIDEDQQSSFGSWEISKPDHEIWSELLKRKDFRGENKFSVGSIEVGEMWRPGCWQPWWPMSFREQ